MFYKNKKIAIDAVDRTSDAKIKMVRKLIDYIPKNIRGHDMTRSSDRALVFAYTKIRSSISLDTEDRVKHAINSKI